MTNSHSGGVAGDLVHYQPHDHADGAGAVRTRVLAVVLPGQLGIELPADVGGHRDPAPQLDVVLRVHPVDHADAHPRVANHVAVLLAPLHRGEQHVTAVTANPYHRGLRAAVGVHGGHDRI